MSNYTVYEDVKNAETGETSVRMHHFVVDNVRTALMYLRNDPNCTGIMKSEDGELKEHSIFYYENELMKEQNVKYPQHILAFDTAILELYFPDFRDEANPLKSLDYQTYMNLMAENAMVVIMRRQELENNEKYLQVLPYVLIRVDTPNGSKFLLYKRPSKGTGESRLAGQLSIGFGGHVDISDVEYTNDIINLHSTLGFNASREISQELRVSRDGINCTPGFDIEFASLFILERSASVHRVHIATVAVMPIEAATFDYYEFHCLEENGGGNTLVGLYSAQELELLLHQETVKLEAWTSTLIKEIQNPHSSLNPYSEEEQLNMTLDGNELGDVSPDKID